MRMRGAALLRPVPGQPPAEAGTAAGVGSRSPVAEAAAPAAAGEKPESADRNVSADNRMSADGTSQQDTVASYAEIAATATGENSAAQSSQGDYSAPRAPRTADNSLSRQPREYEDVATTVVELLNAAFPDMHVHISDIDRAHRGQGNKIWCRFVRSGNGSVRDLVYSSRLSSALPKGNQLYISEALTGYRQEIFHECLALRKQGKLYTVYTRHGSVYVKQRKFGYSTRVDEWNDFGKLGI